MRFLKLIIFGATVSLGSQALAAEVESMAAELARLRSEVEVLSESIDDKKEALKTELRALASQRSSLAAEISREGLRRKQLELRLAKHRDRVRRADARQGVLKPAVLSAIQEVRAGVQAGLPFRTPERLEELDKLHTEVLEDVIEPSVGVVRLWSRVEDELRLGRESGLHQQVITIGGEELLADVARIGMVMLFFQTADGRAGHATLGGEGWSWKVYQTKESLGQVDALFESLKKRVRVGFFELPNALPQVLPKGGE